MNTNVTVCIVGLLTIIGCIVIASQHPSQLSWSFGLGCTAGIYILVMASIHHNNYSICVHVSLCEAYISRDRHKYTYREGLISYDTNL